MFDDLIAKKWVSRKRTPDGLSVLKYSRKIFFDNLWNKDARLAQCRGLVLDDNDNVVQMPFDKVWNHFENGIKVDRDRQVMAIRKINGFMAASTYYRGALLVSTTGSLTSDFVVLARKHLDKPSINDLCRNNSNTTFLWEICDPTDEHIVAEEPGAYLIGAREKRLGSPLLSEETLDTLVDLNDGLANVVKRPEICVGTFDSIRRALKAVKHEGFVIRDLDTGEVLCKLKSPHYLSKKALMRLGDKGVERLWASPDDFKQKIDEEFYSVVDHIRTTHTAEQWAALKDTERRPIIEQFFEQQTKKELV